MTHLSWHRLFCLLILGIAQSSLGAQACIDLDDGEPEDLPELEFPDVICPESELVLSLNFSDETALHNLTYRLDGQTITLTNVVDESQISAFPVEGSVITLVSYEKAGADCGSTINVDYPIQFTSLPVVTVVTFNSPSCQGTGNDGSLTVSASGSIPPYTFSLDGVLFQASPTFSGLVAGDYTVFAKGDDGDDDDDDEGGCVGETTVTLVATENPSLSTETTNPTCGATNGSATLTATGGTPPYTYSRDGVNFQNDPVFNGLAVGNYTFTVRDANSCIDTQEEALDDGANVELGSETTNPTCGEANGSATLTATGGTPPYTYSRDGVNFQNDPVFNGLAVGNYTFTVLDANGCIGTQEEALDDGANVELGSETTNPTCGEANGSTTLTATGGTPPYTYSRDGVNFQNDPVFTGLAAGNYTFTARDTNGCSTSTSLTLAPDSSAGVNAEIISPALDAGNPEISTVCDTEEFDLQGNLPDGTTGQWSIVPPDAGTLTGPNSPLTTATLTASAELIWTLSTAECLAFSTTSRQIRIVASHQLMDDLVNLSDREDVLVDFAANDSLSGSVQIIDGPFNGTASVEAGLIRYTPGSQTLDDSLQYEVCGANCPNACATAWIRFNAEDTDLCAQIARGEIPPSVFPEGLILNGNGANGKLYIRVVDEAICPFVFRDSDMAVFNRWGDRVFQMKSYDNEWDGTGPDGRQLPPGVYYYVLRVESMNFNHVVPLYIFDANDR